MSRVILVVEVVLDGLDRPPVGSPTHIQVRDTSLADVEAPLVAETSAKVAGRHSSWLATAEIEIPGQSLEPRAHYTVFAHVDVDKDGAMSSGDFITTQSYPIKLTGSDEVRQQVAVVRI